MLLVEWCLKLIFTEIKGEECGKSVLFYFIIKIIISFIQYKSKEVNAYATNIIIFCYLFKILRYYLI